MKNKKKPLKNRISKVFVRKKIKSLIEMKLQDYLIGPDG